MSWSVAVEDIGVNEKKKSIIVESAVVVHHLPSRAIGVEVQRDVDDEAVEVLLPIDADGVRVPSPTISVRAVDEVPVRIRRTVAVEGEAPPSRKAAVVPILVRIVVLSERVLPLSGDEIIAETTVGEGPARILTLRTRAAARAITRTTKAVSRWMKRISNEEKLEYITHYLLFENSIMK